MDFHQPVLLEETINILKPAPGKVFLDATLGNGGHTIALLQHHAKVYGLDQDPSNLRLASVRIASLSFDERFTGIHGNFKDMGSIISTIKEPLSGILFDLGLSSNQQKAQDRGFSFNDSQSLDMRLDLATQSLSAETIINTYDHEQLFHIFSFYAQEHFSSDLATIIIKKRQHHPIKSSQELALIISDFYHQHRTNPKINPATKILMALRIATNQEYENLTDALMAIEKIPKTIVAVITFHSGEDRIVKNYLKNHQQTFTKIHQPVHPTYNEVKRNPLARSAILRSYIT